MRRPIWVVLACTFALQLIAPAPTYAWWEYIDALSGPTLKGPHFDGRLLCFMQQRHNPGAAIFPGFKLPCLVKINDGENRRRAFSIDLGLRWQWDNRFPPANRRRVNFVALTPVFTWYPELPLPDRDWREWLDVVDASAGVGTYWFISNAFTGHRGHLYDLRVDFRLPTNLREKHWTWVFAPAGRLGRLWFPKGFEQNAFADTSAGLTSKAMPRNETVMYKGFFWDIDWN